jgi:hypothetical protein
VVIHFKEFHKHFIVYVHVYIFFIEFEFNKKKKYFKDLKNCVQLYACYFCIFNGNHISCHGCEFVITLLCSK